MRVKSVFGTYDHCFLRTSRYMADKSPAIQVWNMEYGPIVKLTVCLEDKDLEPGESYVDVNNFPEALKFIEEYGLGEKTGTYKLSGFCCYPLVRFDMEAVSRYSA